MVGTKQNKAQFSKKSQIPTIKSEYFTRSAVVHSHHFQRFHLKGINDSIKEHFTRSAVVNSHHFQRFHSKGINDSIKEHQVFVNFFNATVVGPSVFNKNVFF